LWRLKCAIGDPVIALWATDGLFQITIGPALLYNSDPIVAC